jgi:aspartate carbamoyltransferase catalytic subunit
VPLGHRHLLGLKDFSRGEIELILETAKSFKEISRRAIPKVPALRGKTIVNLFFEPSTRTRTSFELAAKRLSADVVNFASGGSSLAKGETLLDTALTIQAMNVDLVVVRHSAAGTPGFLSAHLSAGVVNAGDGAHEHPTQALLDMLTMLDHYPRLDGLRVVIIGDIAHSRVARSNCWGLLAMGASVAVCGPPSLMPVGLDRFGVEVFHRLEPALRGADVVYVLRIQRERLGKCFIPSMREYAMLYKITSERLRWASDGALVMHPGPMNRGVEIDSLVADGTQSLILEQVANGVAVRMAVLYLLAMDR